MIPIACSFSPVTHTKISLAILCGSLNALMEEQNKEMWRIFGLKEEE
jgi:hypothetical protein